MRYTACVPLAVLPVQTAVVAAAGLAAGMITTAGRCTDGPDMNMAGALIVVPTQVVKETSNSIVLLMPGQPAVPGRRPRGYSIN